MKTSGTHTRCWGWLPLLAAAAPSLLSGSAALAEEASAEVLPPGVERMIPRGRIAAVTEPTFVSVAEAEISDEAWILGVELNGQARAYSLNLLNRHEVVNDQIGENLFAAVW